MVFLFIAVNSVAADLILEFKNINSKIGNILIAIYNTEESFPSEKLAYKTLEVPAREPSTVLRGIPEGEYALALIHDQNENGKLDTNFLGIPSEGFAFSNNPTIFFGPPSFSKAKFSVNKKKSVVKIEFKNF